MQYIETTEKAFDALFNENGLILESNNIGFTETETARTFQYHAPKLAISGIVINNFIGNIWQYYIRDINA